MPWGDSFGRRMRRLFLENFTVMDVAEPLVSFDETTGAEEVATFMAEKGFDLVGIRKNGLVCGYVYREELTGGSCGQHGRPFCSEDDLVPDSASLLDVVRSLAINQRCFVTILDRVGAIVTLSDLEKPPMRMFLFGFITIIETMIARLIQQRYPNGEWQEFLSESRLEKAQALFEERKRRNQGVSLIDCLQFGDKGWIVTYDEEFRKALGHESRKSIRTAVKELEMLRNNLAHTQEIIPEGWQRIVIATANLEKSLEENADPLAQYRIDQDTDKTDVAQ